MSRCCYVISMSRCGQCLLLVVLLCLLLPQLLRGGRALSCHLTGLMALSLADIEVAIRHVKRQH